MGGIQEAGKRGWIQDSQWARSLEKRTKYCNGALIIFCNQEPVSSTGSKVGSSYPCPLPLPPPPPTSGCILHRPYAEDMQGALKIYLITCSSTPTSRQLHASTPRHFKTQCRRSLAQPKLNAQWPPPRRSQGFP